MTEALPNAFSPNGDGINDSFEIKPFINPNTVIHSFLIRIYNRWGQLVFESNSVFKSWDGTTKKGNKVPADTYAYTIFIQTSLKDEFRHKGSITLIR
ncbi:MAG: gliding motility-associated C-terminal domain-containing protein [Chitinophagaceae bacterium]|nr:gliding motility-associated C-terminal domain-containing protein [Chitinophagaceae bacterium]